MSPRPEEIEGSAARAADRGAPMGMGFFEEPIDERPYLGDPDSVEDVLRDFGDKVSTAAAGNDKDACIAAMEAAVERFTGIFYGRDTGYRSMPFNSPEQLGRWVNEQMGTSEEDDRSVAMLLWQLAGSILATKHEFLEDKIDEEALDFRLSVAIEDATRILLGLPLESADEE